MAVLTPTFPTTLDTLTTLGEVEDVQSSTIGVGGVDATAPTIPITSTTGWTSTGMVWCGTEGISYTGKTSTSITGCVRGFRGTASTHAAGDTVYASIISSAHYEALRDQIIVLQTALGITNGLMAPRILRDRGGQVFNVKAYGAIGDGAADDTAEIQAAIDACGAAGGGTVYLPSGDYKISSTLYIGDGTEAAISTTNSIGFVGDGSGVSDVLTVPHYASTELQWYGAAAGTMLEVRGPITGIHLSNFHLDGKTSTNAAGTLLKTTHMQQSTVSHITGDRWSVLALDIQAYDAPAGTVEGARGVTWENLRFTWPTVGTASGIRIGAALHGTTPFLDVAHNYFENVMVDVALGVTTPTGSALILRFCDNLTFNHCGFGAEFTNGKSIDVQVPSDDTSWPSTIVFYNCNLYGPVVVTGGPMTGLHGLTFLPLQTGDDSRIPTGAVIKGVTTEGLWFGDWRQQRTQSAALTDITESVANNAIKVQVLHVEPSYAPGIIWYASDNNPTRPKAGIFEQSTVSGSYLHIATSSNYGAGMNNIGFTQGPSGAVSFAADITVPAEVYGSGWNGSNEAPTKNDVYDQIQKVAYEEIWDWSTDADMTALSGASIQDLFGSTTAITTLANTRYEFEVLLWYARTTAGTVTFTFTNTQTYTFLNAQLLHSPAAGSGQATSLGISGIEGITTAAASLPATASQTLNTAQHALIKGVFKTGTAGNFRFRVTNSAGTLTVQAGSKFKIRRLPSGNISSFVV